MKDLILSCKDVWVRKTEFVAKNQFLYSKKSFRSVRFIIETFDRTERNLDLIESYKTSIESEKTIIR